LPERSNIRWVSVITVRSYTGMTSALRVSAPIVPICVTCASSNLATAAAQIGGYLRVSALRLGDAP
jgi:hypothetical protein